MRPKKGGGSLTILPKKQKQKKHIMHLKTEACAAFANIAAHQCQTDDILFQHGRIRKHIEDLLELRIHFACRGLIDR